MPEVEVVRKQIIVVGEIKGLTTGPYPKWVFTDQDGKEYKINPARKDYFTDIVKPGVAVELGYATFKGNEYIYSAILVKDKLPDEVRVDKEMAKLAAEQRAKGDPPVKEAPMTKTDWTEKDRITRKSIERQKSLELAVEVAKMTGDCDDTDVLARAKRYENYLEGKEVEPAESKLVREAKKLGKIIEEGEDRKVVK